MRRSGKDEWQPRDCDDLSRRMSAQYGLPIDMSPKTGGLKAIAKALNQGDIALAQIATVLLGIPDPLPFSTRPSSREQMTKLGCDLHWSGLLKWDSGKHPRWPAGSDDGRGGEFAPKDAEAEASAASQSIGWESARQSTQALLVHAGMGGRSPIVLTAAEIEDERDPRLGVGGNHPPLDELIPG